MKKITNLKDRFIARREEAQANENGFSLLELVVAIGILLVLTVGGLIGYSAITGNAKTAAAQSAASEISTAVMVALSDSDDGNDTAAVNPTTYTDDYDGIDITIVATEDGDGYVVTTVHEDQAGDDEKTFERTVKP